MSGAPGTVTDRQLRDLHIRLRPEASAPGTPPEAPAAAPPEA